MENTAPNTQIQNTLDADNSPATGNLSGSANLAVGDKASATKSAAEAAMRKMKIDDQEIDEAEVVKVYKERTGHQREANKRFQEGQKAKKQAEEFIQQMKDEGRLFEVLQKLGHNPRTLAEKYLAAALEEEMLDPKEKEVRQYKSKLEQYEAKEKADREAKEKADQDALKKKLAEDYSNEFVEALKSTGLPATKPMVAEIAKYIARSAKIKFPMTAIEAAKLVQQDLESFDKHRLHAADGERLAKMLGEEGLKKVREYDTGRLKDPKSQLKTPEVQGDRRSEPQRRNPMTPEQWREFNRK